MKKIGENLWTESSWYGDDEDRKSTVGYVFMLGIAPVSWNSRKESVIALSSCEAEYITSSLYVCQTTLMVNLIYEIEGKDHWVIIMIIENMYVINLFKNPIAYGMNKHIKMRFHYLREEVSNGRLFLEHCRSEN